MDQYDDDQSSIQKLCSFRVRRCDFGAESTALRCHVPRIFAAKLACVCTVLALLQQNWPALALSSHFCSRTGLRWHCPRISAAKLPCVATFLAFLQQNWPALALPPHVCSRTALRCRFPHFCSRTALHCRFPRISAAKLPCAATALRFHCAAWPLSRVATCSVALCDGVTLVSYNRNLV